MTSTVTFGGTSGARLTRLQAALAGALVGAGVTVWVTVWLMRRPARVSGRRPSSAPGRGAPGRQPGAG